MNPNQNLSASQFGGGSANGGGASFTTQSLNSGANSGLSGPTGSSGQPGSVGSPATGMAAQFAGGMGSGSQGI